MTTPPPYRVPAHVFTALARGGGGPEAVRLLRSARRSKTVMLIRQLLDDAHATGHPEAADARRAYHALAQVRRTHRAAVEHVLDHPSVGAWATRTALLLHQGRGAEAEPAKLAGVALAAAVRGACGVTVPAPAGGTVVLPSLGSASLPGTAKEIVVRPGQAGALLVAGEHMVTIPPDPHRDGPGWRAIPRIVLDGHQFLVDDESFPPLPAELRQGAADDIALWRQRITDGWNLLTEHHADVADEIRSVVGVLSPLETSAGGQASATLGHAFGCVFLSLPADAVSVGVTLAHELQHAKLAVVMDLLPLLTGHPDELFYAPWRTDPRPLSGLLHGAYAHLGVAAFWGRQRHVPDSPARTTFANREFARWRSAARDAADVLLTSGHLNDTGRRFVSEMADALDTWLAESLPADVASHATRARQDHLTHWLAANKDRAGVRTPTR